MIRVTVWNEFVHEREHEEIRAVYPDGIHLRGRDFVKGEFLPIASYWLGTP